MYCIPFFHNLKIVSAVNLGNHFIPYPYHGQNRTILYRTKWRCVKCGVIKDKLLYNDRISYDTRKEILNYLTNRGKIGLN